MNKEVVALIDKTYLDGEILDILDYITDDMRDLDDILAEAWTAIGSADPMPIVEAEVEEYTLTAKTDKVMFNGVEQPFKIVLSLDELNSSVDYGSFYLGSTLIGEFRRDDGYEFIDEYYG